MSNMSARYHQVAYSSAREKPVQRFAPYVLGIQSSPLKLE